MSSDLPAAITAGQGAIHSIVKFGDPVLEKAAEPVVAFNDELDRVVEDMFASMYAANGLGLAAPQIGISRRIAVVDISFKHDPNAKIVLINPEIIDSQGRETLEEGCLSIPGFREKVTRAARITVRARNALGEWFELAADDLLARALQHEIDHLDGRLFLSRVSGLKRELLKRQIRKLIRAGKW
jgi:peptide deformylase